MLLLTSPRGEDGVGTWKVIIKDSEENKFKGSLVDWQLTLWGEAIDADKAELHPLPGEEENHKTTTAASIATTTISTKPGGTPGVTANPSDHIDRPVNAKPTAASSGQLLPSSIFAPKVTKDSCGFRPVRPRPVRPRKWRRK